MCFLCRYNSSLVYNMSCIVIIVFVMFSMLFVFMLFCMFCSVYTIHLNSSLVYGFFSYIERQDGVAGAATSAAASAAAPFQAELSEDCRGGACLECLYYV